ncbi:MFS general substrate transporter [Patellaria atrata CBS 101060]|uniref:MFS general substrate transporter n=1 Tax=Patellaria atrata CBS 101060 TaxID=1346257 RepID=A0A9P4VMG0_9PEZI|nr:MFS general substrate transporter [Patellaria atrata CBS 101060]
MSSLTEKQVSINEQSSLNNSSSEIESQPASQGDEKVHAPFKRKTRGITWILVVVAILSSIFLYALDNTIVADVVPSITQSLGSSELLPWLSVGFMIGGVGVALPFGKIFGLYNVKWLYIFSLTLFMVGSALCGAAPNMNAMIVGRVIAGVGGNGMYLGVITLLSVNTEEKERPMYLALVGLVFGVGTCVGPLIGGAFAESPVGWPFAFYLNLIIGGLFAPVYLFMLPTFDPRPGVPYTERSREIDYVGTVLSIGMIVFTVIGINFGGAIYAWKSATVIVMLVLGVLSCIAFFAQQGFAFLTTKDHRVFPMQFLRRPEYILLFCLTSAANAAGFCVIYYIPLYFQFAKGEAPVAAAVKILPLIVFISATILVNGALMGKFGYYKPWYVVGTALMLIGGVLISRVNTSTSTAYVYGMEVILGLGVGSHIQSGFAVIQSITEPAVMAYAITFMMVAQLLGIAMGLSVSGAVFVNVAISKLQVALPRVPRKTLLAFISGARSELFDTLTVEEKAGTVHALVETIQKVFVCVYAAAAFGFVLSLFLRRQKVASQISA